VGEIPTKSHDQRKVPISKRLGHPTLPGHLVAHRIRAKDPHGRVFGSGDQPFSPTSVTRRAERAWGRAGLEPITLHECRHTYASTMIASGANAKTISTYMGHANINITLDLYGKLMPGNEAEAADLLDAYLNRCLGDPLPG
jgi:integrase